MNNSYEYCSLFDLVNSHLSKASVQKNDDNTCNNSIKNLPFNGVVSESSSALFKRPYVPPFDISERTIQKVLDEQVANMLKAKEITKRKQEMRKVDDEMRKLKIEEEREALIDLTKAIQTPFITKSISHPGELLSSRSSCESLFNLKFNNDDDDDEQGNTKSQEPLLPCITDMSYILTQKIKTGKGSSFGKVLSSHLRVIAAPYLKTKVPTSITRFNFNTASPCDILKKKFRKLTVSCT